MKKNNTKSKITLLAILFTCALYQLQANNIAVSNVTISGQNNALKFKLVNFDIGWDNSWMVNSGPNNWDAAWVFVKYLNKSDNTWHHATLHYLDGTGAADGHTEPANSNISSRNDNGANGAHGVFIHRTDMGQGTVAFTGVQLRWDYGVDGLGDGDVVEVCVLAIEMVYVPQGSFVVGSGGNELGAFYTYPTTTNPYTINSEAAITVGSSAGNLYYSSIGLSGDQSGPIPAAFPKGYNAFYCMKYEITQSQYIAFLNKLTYAQQVTRTSAAPSSVSGTAALSGTFRNGIEIMTQGIASTTPAIYASDYTNDGSYDQADDGQSIACNWLTWADVAAYLDWSALRPMTELEYEKAGRGNLLPVPNENAWGNTVITGATVITFPGASNEIAQAGSNSAYDNAAGVQGPMRSGCFAQATTTRAGAGASYFGIMELSGNLWEQPVTVGNTTGRSFTGVLGNGLLAGSGDADASLWPGYGGLRGGSWSSSQFEVRLSYRLSALGYGGVRSSDIGGRGVR